MRPPGPLTNPADTLYQGTGVGAGQEDARMGLGYINHDMTLMKNFSLGSGRNLQVRAEAYNVFNTTQYQGVNTVADVRLRDRRADQPGVRLDQRRARQFEPRDPARGPAARSNEGSRVQGFRGSGSEPLEPLNLEPLDP